MNEIQSIFPSFYTNNADRIFFQIQGEEAADIKPGRTFTLRQFLRLYQAIGPLLEAAQFNPNKILEHPDIMTSSIFQDR